MSEDEQIKTDQPPGELSLRAAEATLATACTQVGLESTGAQLMRLGEHAVFRLASRPVVVRIARSAHHLPELRRGIAMAKWLQAVDFPAVRAVDGIEQPLVVDDRVATFWEALSDQYASVPDLAVLLHRFHMLEPPTELAVPLLHPLDRTRRRVNDGTLPPADKNFLLERADALDGRWAALDHALPPGLIHGDASIGNIIRAHDGQPVLIDLDGCAIGPREWDLVLTALYFERLGWHSGEEYRQFCDIYGFDVMTWPGYRVLCDMRELIMVGWLSQKVDESDSLRGEVMKRIGDLRSERAGRLEWQPI